MNLSAQSHISVKILFLLLSALVLANCSGGKAVEDKSQFPMNPEDARKLRNGKLTGEGGWNLFGGDDGKDKESGSPIGVNSFLWRASLDTLSFLPIASADPFGGVILTDWYSDANAPRERYKVTTLILGRALRADGVKVTVFKQSKDENGNWQDEPVNAELGRKLEDTILTQARELRIKSGG